MYTIVIKIISFQDQFNILLYRHVSQNTEDDRRSSSYAIGRTKCDKCTLGYIIMSINLKAIRKEFGVSKKSETPIEFELLR